MYGLSDSRMDTDGSDASAAEGGATRISTPTDADFTAECVLPEGLEPMNPEEDEDSIASEDPDATIKPAAINSTEHQVSNGATSTLLSNDDIVQTTDSSVEGREAYDQGDTVQWPAESSGLEGSSNSVQLKSPNPLPAAFMAVDTTFYKYSSNRPERERFLKVGQLVSRKASNAKDISFDEAMWCYDRVKQGWGITSIVECLLDASPGIWNTKSRTSMKTFLPLLTSCFLKTLIITVLSFIFIKQPFRNYFYKAN